MKKNLFYLFALVCSMSLFIACSDDDPDYSTAIDGEIVGNYKGTLNVTVQGQLLGKDIPQKISVAKAGLFGRSFLKSMQTPEQQDSSQSVQPYQ